MKNHRLFACLLALCLLMPASVVLATTPPAKASLTNIEVNQLGSFSAEAKLTCKGEGEVFWALLQGKSIVDEGILEVSSTQHILDLTVSPGCAWTLRFGEGPIYQEYVFAVPDVGRYTAMSLYTFRVVSTPLGTSALDSRNSDRNIPLSRTQDIMTQFWVYFEGDRKTKGELVLNNSWIVIKREGEVTGVYEVDSFVIPSSWGGIRSSRGIPFGALAEIGTYEAIMYWAGLRVGTTPFAVVR